MVKSFLGGTKRNTTAFEIGLEGHRMNNNIFTPLFRLIINKSESYIILPPAKIMIEFELIINVDHTRRYQDAVVIIN